MFKSSHILNSLFMPTSLAVAMMMVGCTDKPAETVETEPTGTTETPVTEVNTTSKDEVATSTLADAQEIVINNGTEPESLDPHLISGVPEANILRQMIVGLASTDIDGNTVPGMAESWESADNKVWTFKIRDANWSNGDPVTAQDFVYSMRRIVDPNTAAPYASYLVDAQVANADDIIDGKADVESLGVKAIDDKTLEITLSEPVPYFPDTLIHTATYPVHQKTVEEFGDKWTDPANIVINGPYKISNWQINDKIELTRNESYYDNANTTVEKITMLPLTDATGAIKRYKAGEIDVTTTVPSELFKSLKDELGDEVKVTPSLCTYYYEFNTVKPPFDDVRVRRALALALDRDVITERVLAQGQTPAYQFTPPSTQGMMNNTPEWAGWDKEKRNEEATKLLAEAGFDKNNPLKFELLYNTSEAHKKIAVAATSLLKSSLGAVEITPVNQEWKTYLDARREGDYAVARAGWCGDYNEPSTFLNILKTGNSNNHGKYQNANFDNLMSQTLKAGVTPEQRANLYKEIEVQLDKDMPVINIYHYVGVKMIKPYVKNFTLKDPLTNYQVKDMTIEKH